MPKGLLGKAISGLGKSKPKSKGSLGKALGGMTGGKKKFAPGKKVTRRAPSKPGVKKVDAIITKRAPKKATPKKLSRPKKFARGKKLN